MRAGTPEEPGELIRERRRRPGRTRRALAEATGVRRPGREYPGPVDLDEVLDAVRRGG